MSKSRLFLCNGAICPEDEKSSDKKIVILNSFGMNSNVNIQIENITKFFLKALKPRLVDLIEIATYIYTADCSTYRGDKWTNNNSTEAWQRNFTFVIAVRDLAFWNQPEVKAQLEYTLQFLSNDNYKFFFTELNDDRPYQGYLQLNDDQTNPFDGTEQVVMFSGGLDSLAGALESVNGGSKVVLVSHRSVAVVNKRQVKLFQEISRRYLGKVAHIPVWVNKTGFDGESTQRTRSFLYSALGCVVAESLKSASVRFFENGVVSLNLPVADEVIRARASRTTHPQGLALMAKLFGSVLNREFTIDNPFLFRTKTEVIDTIVNDHRQRRWH